MKSWMRSSTAALALACAGAQVASGGASLGSALVLALHAGDHAHSVVLTVPPDGDHRDPGTAGALVLSVAFVPAAIAVLLRGRIEKLESRMMHAARRAYEPVLDAALRRPVWVLGSAVALLVTALAATTRMGSEFIPSLDEGDVALHALRSPGTSLTQAVSMQAALERALRSVPEVETAFAKIGTAEVATDPMPPSVADGFVTLKDRSDRPDSREPKHEAAQALEQAVAGVPGDDYEFTQPIEMRMNEFVAGVRSDVAVKPFGDDRELLRETGERIAKILERVPGAADVKAEPITGLPMLEVEIDREALARYGLSQAAVQDVLGTAIGGSVAGQVFEGDRHLDVVVRLPETLRADLTALERLPILLPELTGEPSRGSTRARRTRRRARSYRSAPWRSSPSARVPTRSAARTASAGWSSRRTSRAATSARWSRRPRNGSAPGWSSRPAPGSPGAASSSSSSRRTGGFGWSSRSHSSGSAEASRR